MNNTQKVILAGLAGAVAGAIAGVLLAPAEGKKTRQKIADSMQDVTNSISKSVDDIRANVSNLMHTGKQAAKEFAANDGAVKSSKAS